MLDRVRQAMKTHHRSQLPLEDLIPAAVLVPLFWKDEELHFLMQCRTQQVEKHKGQISFPGGVAETSDRDLIHTALRESEEEVGLKQQDVEVLGLLDDTLTISGFRITPVVGRIPYPYDFAPSPDEVEEILQVPWRLFIEADGHHRHELEHDGQTFEVDFYPFEGHQIWGATARITRQLIELAGD